MKVRFYGIWRWPVSWRWFFALCLCCLSLPGAAVQTITLAWDRNMETDIAGYKLYFGTSSRNYSNVVDLGNNTSHSVSNLLEDATYYFAVTAYNNAGTESDLSTEVSHTLFKVLPVSRNLNGTLTITWVSTPPAVYRVLYKDDLNQPDWNVLSGVITATGPSTFWVDATAGTTTSRFYKIERLVL